MKGLLLEAKRGDIVVVPPPGWRRDVLIYEIMDEPGLPVRVTALDDEISYVYLGRKVRRLASVEKRLLRRGLLEKLQNPQAFFSVGLSLQADVYDLAYENYVWRGTFVSTFKTTKDRFSSADNLVTSVWFNGLAASDVEAVKKAGSPPSGSFTDLALLTSGAPSENELVINTNSPITFIIRSASAFALSTMAMLPLSAAEAQQVADGTARITMHAVGSADPACSLVVEAAVAEHVRALGPQRLLDACQYGQRAREGASLTTKVRLKKHRKTHN